MEPVETKQLSQLRRGVLEYCVLSLLSDTSLYAFDLVHRLSEADGMVISEGTIYPLLSRLRREDSRETLPGAGRLGNPPGGGLSAAGW